MNYWSPSTLYNQSLPVSFPEKVNVKEIWSWKKRYLWKHNRDEALESWTTGITKTSGKPDKAWENESFTGKWDVCFVPTSSKLLKDHVNVVQPHNTSGVIARVSNGTGFATNNGTDDKKDNGTVTGNTTTNPILGYAIREGAIGYLEIAQRK